MNELLKKSEKESMVSFIYNSLSSLEETRSLFLMILNTFKELLPTIDYTIRLFMYDTIKSIVMRAEINDLTMLGTDRVIYRILPRKKGAKPYRSSS